MLQQVIHGVNQVEKKKKIIQFTLIFHLLNHGHPMTWYMTMKKLFVQLNGFDNPMKHWSNGVGWEMVDNMCKQIMKRPKSVMAKRQVICPWNKIDNYIT